MPTRLLREGIIDSEAVNALTIEAEVFYRRLMSVVDDFGRFDARPAVLRSRLYPLRVDRITDADILRWLDECNTASLITLYVVGSKPLLEYHKIGTPRAKESKYPPPPASRPAQPFTSENTCSQVNTSAPYSGSGPTSDAGTGSGPTPGAEPPANGGEVSLSVGFDPLRESQANRKAFEAAWNAAGLRPLKRLTHTLHSRLDALLLDRAWAETWREALTRAGQIPFLATGVGRQQGALDPSEFLRDDDFAAAILRGKYDPRAATTKPPPGGPPPAPPPKSIDELIAEEAARTANGVAP